MERSPPDERRQHVRIPIDVVVRFRFDSLASFVAEHAVNLSQGGMFIRAERPPALGAIVFVEMALKDGSELVQGVAEVVRHVGPGGEEPAGFGVQFQKLDARSRSLIEAICARGAR